MTGPTLAALPGGPTRIDETRQRTRTSPLRPRARDDCEPQKVSLLLLLPCLAADQGTRDQGFECTDAGQSIGAEIDETIECAFGVSRQQAVLWTRRPTPQQVAERARTAGCRPLARRSPDAAFAGGAIEGPGVCPRLAYPVGLREWPPRRARRRWLLDELQRSERWLRTQDPSGTAASTKRPRRAAR